MLNVHESFLKAYTGYFEEIENLGKDYLGEYKIRPEEDPNIVRFTLTGCIGGIDFGKSSAFCYDCISKASWFSSS